MTDPFVQTRESLHAVAEHVLAAARHRAVGRIGLTVTPGGFGTPPFGEQHTTISVDGTSLVVRSGPSGTEVGRAPLTTLRDAAVLAGIEAPGGPASVYHLNTPCPPDAPLVIDPSSAARIADWYALGNAALRQWREEISGDDPSEITLWPEHADVALRAADVNYGAGLGDEYVPVPYLYVGPPQSVLTSQSVLSQSPVSSGGFWNAPFGAYLRWEDVRSVADAVTFFRAGRRHALG